MKKYFLLILLMILFFRSESQKQYREPEIGKPLPVFVFNDLENATTKTFSTAEAKGKWLILDLWSAYCTGCIASFPKLDSISKKYQAQVKIISVGEIEFEKPGLIRKTFQRAKEKKGIQFVNAYDSVLFNYYGIAQVPFIIIIDPDGIVRRITSSISTQAVAAMLKGDVSLFPLTHKDRMDVAKKYKQIRLKEDSLTLYSAQFSRWNQEGDHYSMFPVFVTDDKLYNEVKLTMSLDKIYRFAYTGMATWGSKDSNYRIFKYHPIVDDPQLIFPADSIYNFNWRSPVGKKKLDIQQLLQKILTETFSYKVLIEKRKVLFWKLTLTDSSKHALKTKYSNGLEEVEEPFGKSMGFSAKNTSIKALIGKLYPNHQINRIGNNPILDFSGMKERIDIVIDAYMPDFNQVLAELERNGILLKKDFIEMNCLVIARQ